LIGVRALLRRGIEVRSLSRLHAKVLICDWRTATIGSQNFTSYGRGSHETTAVPTDDLS
jgi:phosphatidylserine/phosphatidylglycerophosphate/cardiolipin synthase-like enzyme